MEGRSRGTVGSLRPNTRFRNRPLPPPTFTLCLLITHRYKRIHFSWVFPGHGEERGTGQRETEGWKRRGRKDGGLALKQGSDHHYRGAIVLQLPRPFLMRAPEGGGAGRRRNRKVGGGGLRYAESQWGMTINPTPKPVGQQVGHGEQSGARS